MITLAVFQRGYHKFDVLEYYLATRIQVAQ